MINKYIAIGHLTKDPETKEFTNNTKCSFGLALNQGKDETLFWDVECWNRVAENCQKYIKKGSCVYVEGKIKESKWEDKNGNPRSKRYVSADLVRFLPNGKKENNELKVEKPESKPIIEPIIEDEEMPF
jgi:single-strand DNA-binding protein